MSHIYRHDWPAECNGWCTVTNELSLHDQTQMEHFWPNRNGKFFCILSLPLGPVTVSYLKASLAKRWDQNLYGRIIAVNLGYRSMRKFLVFQRYKLWYKNKQPAVCTLASATGPARADLSATVNVIHLAAVNSWSHTSTLHLCSQTLQG